MPLDSNSHFRFVAEEVIKCPLCPCPQAHQGTFTLYGAQGQEVMKCCLTCFVRLGVDHETAQDAYYQEMLCSLADLLLPAVGQPDAALTGAANYLLELGVFPPGLAPEVEALLRSGTVTMHAYDKRAEAPQDMLPMPPASEVADDWLRELGFKVHTDD